MKITLSLLVLFSLSLYSLEEEDISFSLILGNVNKNEVNKAFLSLPKRSSVNILRMCNLMTSAKEKYNLNDYESAYLVYYWISQTIQIDCANKFSQYSTPLNTYNQGKSSYAGISALFFTMLSNLGIESNIVTGKTKIITDNTSNGQIFEIKDHIWNYAYIDKKPYLFDPTSGIGYCDESTFKKKFTDFFFGPKPEYLIYINYPNDSSWQLLDKTISSTKFNSWPYMSGRFFEYGFRSFTPEGELEINSSSKIQLNSESSKALRTMCMSVSFSYGKWTNTKYTNCELSNGVFKANFSGSEKMNFFIMFASPQDEEIMKTIMIYKVKN